MKSSLSYTYFTLLFVSLVSSSLLFILVASEASKAADAEPNVDENAMDTVAFAPAEENTNIVDSFEDFIKKSSVKKSKKKTRKPPLSSPSMSALNKNEPPDFKELIFLETLSKNAGVTTHGLQDLPGASPVITLMDQGNDLKIESKLEESIEATLKNITQNITSKMPPDIHDETNVVKDEEHVAKIQKHDDGEATPPSLSSPSHQEIVLEAKINDSGGVEVQNVTESVPDVNLTEENPMPVFSEWTQKQMEEAEKKMEENVNASSMRKNSKPSNGKQPSLKLRMKNYAAPDCGAKILASNHEAQSTASVLTSHKDEYLLNPCTSRIWFVVELCEPIQAERVELANFELFSSSPKEFSVAVSNRFPTRDWSNVGQFTAKDERDVQSFNLHPQLFGKFVRVDIHSHYNKEHYCPVSLFRVYGTSEFEAFETDNQPVVLNDDDDDDDEENENIFEGTSATKKKNKNQNNNILKSAGEAVMNIVKKAAEVLVKQNDNHLSENETAQSTAANRKLSKQHCFTFAYNFQCADCTNEFRSKLEDTLNCNYNLLTSLLSLDVINKKFDESQHYLCANILGFNLNGMQEDHNHHSLNMQNNFLNILPQHYIAGLCNMKAAESGKLELKLIVVASEKPHQEHRQDFSSSSSSSSLDKNISTAEPPSVPPELTIKIDDAKVDSEKREEIKIQPTPTLEPDDSSSVKIVENDVNIFNVVEDLHAGTPEIVDVPVTPPLPHPPKKEEAAEKVVEKEENNQHWEQIDENILEQQIEAAPSHPGSPGHNSAPPSQKVQPESVFLRLSNRIKALERNMSLSGQYLEELSRRYKKQVEELQHSFAKTLHTIEEQNRRSLEREQTLREENVKLRTDLNDFVESILNWKNILLYVGVFVGLQIIILCTLLRSCSRNTRVVEVEKVVSKKSSKKGLVRRKSIDGIGVHVSPSLKKKRPSEEALDIVGTSYEELLISESAEQIGDFIKPERKRNKNKNRKISVPNLSRASSVDVPPRKQKAELVRSESVPVKSPFELKEDEDVGKDDGNRIDELPLLEDNDEFIIPTASDLAYNEFIPDATSEQITNLNGNSIKSSNSSIDSKSTNKSRRLSSPAFFKTSLLRGSISRKSEKKPPKLNNVPESGSNNSSSNSWDWYKLKKSSSQDKFKKKSKSESPENHNNNNNSSSINSSVSDNVLDVSSNNASSRTNNSSSFSSAPKKTTGGSFRSERA